MGGFTELKDLRTVFSVGGEGHESQFDDFCGDVHDAISELMGEGPGSEGL